jgi:hypothetical protein
VTYYKKPHEEETNHVRKVNNLLARETDTNKFETMNKREGHSLIQTKKERVILARNLDSLYVISFI